MLDLTNLVAISSYLENTGWAVTGRYCGAMVWERDDQEVLVPVSTEFRDYDRRINELLAVLNA